MHSVLASQISRSRSDEGVLDVEALCALVEKTYTQMDQQRARGERAIALMVKEIEEANAAREATLERLPRARRRSKGCSRNMPASTMRSRIWRKASPCMIRRDV